MNRIFTRLGFTAAALVAGSGVAAYAQSATTGMITGRVTDAKGAAISGVTMSLSGASLQGVRTVVTNPDGTYRFPFIPTGSGYKLQAVKADMITQDVNNLNLVAWQTFTQDFKMKVTSAGATVEVIATQTTIDPSSVTNASTFTPESIKQLPLASREVSGAVFLAPGVVDGGRGVNSPNISGGTAFENNYIVDGQNVTDPLYGENRTRINTLAVESVQVQSGGFEPEYGRATGGVVSVVTKTGSNDFKMDFEAAFRPSSGIAKASAQAALPFSSARTSQGDQSTYALWLGGAILKDKLWYSLGVSSDNNETQARYGQVYFLDPEQAGNNPLAVPADPLVTGHPNNGTSYTLKSKFLGITGKLTYSLNTDNTFELGLARNREENDVNNLGMTYSDLVSMAKSHPQDVDTVSLNWRSTLTPNWLLDVRAGTYKRKQYTDLSPYQKNTMYTGTSLPSYLQSGVYTDDGSGPLFPAYYARAYPGQQLGGYAIDQANELNRKQFSAKGTNFIGSHIVKYGVDYDETTYKSFFAYTGGALVTRDYNVDPTTGALASYRDTYRFRKGINGGTVTSSTGHVSTNVLGLGQGLDLESKTKNLAYFVQDTWQVTNKITLIFGLRADSQKLYGGDGQEYFKFSAGDMLAPRFGITWDPVGSGQTKLSASFGRFYESIPMDLNQRAGSIEGFEYFRRTYSGPNSLAGAWTAPSVNNVYNPATGAGAAADPTIGAGAASWYRTIGGSKSDVDPNMKPQSIEEVGLGWEQQLTTLWRFAAKWKYRYYKNVVEDFSFDFGTNYVIGNPGQGGLGGLGALVQNYDYPGQNEVLYFPKPIRDYRELVLSLDKAKGEDKWALNASLTFATSMGNFAGLDSPLNGQADPNITSTYDLPTLMRNTYGPMPNTPKYNFQTTGTYDIGWGVTAGGRFIYRAGTAISALGPDLGYLTYDGTNYYSFNGQFLHDGNYGNNEALLEPRGSRGVTPDVTRFDLHVEWSKDLNLLKKTKLTIFGDVFNVFNQQMALSVNQSQKFQALVTGAPTTASGVVVGPEDPSVLGYIAVDNPRFLQPTAFQAPRNIQLGFRLNF